MNWVNSLHVTLCLCYIITVMTICPRGRMKVWFSQNVYLWHKCQVNARWWCFHYIGWFIYDLIYFIYDYKINLWPFSTCYVRCSNPGVFLGKGVLKIWSTFIGEHPCRSAISIKLLWNWNDISVWVFSCKSAACFWNTFS